MTTVEELRHRAKHLANTYDTLAELKWTPTRQAPARKMRPTFGPMSPEPDQDWALNLEHELMRETSDEHVPGGLRTMACDALGYTTARRTYLDETRPSMLCAYIYRHSPEIAEHFPAVDDLAELLTAQHDYLTHQITTRFGTTPTTTPPMVQATGFGTAADLAPLATAATGRNVDRKRIYYWGKSGRITPYCTADGTTHYSLAEVINAARTYYDERRKAANT